MRRSHKQRTLALVYEYIEPGVLERLHQLNIEVHLDQTSGLRTVFWPTSLHTEIDGERIGLQLYDNSTVVSVAGERAFRLHPTRETDRLHRPSFAEQAEKK